jgi:hypothetical protein
VLYIIMYYTVYSVMHFIVYGGVPYVRHRSAKCEEYSVCDRANGAIQQAVQCLCGCLNE